MPTQCKPMTHPKGKFVYTWQRDGYTRVLFCQVTGKKPHFGKQLSHSHRRTSRRWDPNVQTKRYYLPSEKRWIKLNLSTKGIKTIDKRGIERVVADMRAAGQKI